MKAIDDAIATACEGVPGLAHGVLMLLPDGFLIGGTGAARVSDQEPLVRAAARCFALRPAPAFGDEPYAEYIFALDDQFVVALRGQGDARLALAVVCSRVSNLGLVVASTRRALRTLEGTIDLAAWGLA